VGLRPAAYPMATVRSGDDSKITPTSARLTIASRNSNGYVDAYASNDQIFDGSIASDDEKVTLPGYKCARQNTEFGPGGMCHYWMYHFESVHFVLMLLDGEWVCRIHAESH
jgi:hypothetical protein